MDPTIRDLHHELHPPARRPALDLTKGVVDTFTAGPPRLADIFEEGDTEAITDIVVLDSCPALSPGDVVWMHRKGDMRLVFDRETT